MTDQQLDGRYRFGVFEADAATGELRRGGVRIKLNAQPFQVLLLLLEQPGTLLTREDISRQLWPDGTFVDYEHGVNSAVNRIREAIGDTASNPRFIETLARRGYRFIAPVERISNGEGLASLEQSPAPATAAGKPRIRILATEQELPKTPYAVVQTLFVLLQLMYLGYYIGALANLPEIQELFSALPRPTVTLYVLIVTAALLIPVRTFLLCATLFHAPRIREKFLTIWGFLLPCDVLWALSPFLLLRYMSFGLAVACTTFLLYSPFAQRSLALMGAGRATQETLPAAR